MPQNKSTTINGTEVKIKGIKGKASNHAKSQPVMDSTQKKENASSNEPVTDKLTADEHSKSTTLSRKAPIIQIQIPEKQPNESMDQHNAMLQHEFSWLSAVLKARIGSYFKKSHIKMSDFAPPAINEQSRYGAFIHQHNLNLQQRFVVSMALATFISPNIFDVLKTKNKLYNSPYTEFGEILNLGGMVKQSSTRFIPTIRTALFILAGEDLQQYLDAMALFNADELLFATEIIESPSLHDDMCLMDAPLKLTSLCLDNILLGRERDPQYSADFPATALTTHLEWADLVLMEDTEHHLQELMLWLKHNNELIEKWGANPADTGYKALFYGPSGTGKTLAASLLAKKLNKPIYRIDLSKIVSKFIGETQKNLSKIFQCAKQKDWILFFDEADSLFSKRSRVSNANDRHANQETAYLLQRIETCQNLVILASNLKDNIDEAFLRRFQSIIHFPEPDAEQREKLWRNGFSITADLSNINIPNLAQKYDLTGAEINNVIRFASFKAIDKGNTLIHLNDIITASRREKFKKGRVI